VFYGLKARPLGDLAVGRAFVVFVLLAKDSHEQPRDFLSIYLTGTTDTTYP